MVVDGASIAPLARVDGQYLSTMAQLGPLDAITIVEHVFYSISASQGQEQP